MRSQQRETQLSVYHCHGDKSRCTRTDPTKTHGEGITVWGPQTGGRGPPIEDRCSRLGLPEGSEDPQPTEFIAKLLVDLLGLHEKPGLERAHHTLRAMPKEGEPPHPMVIRVTPFQVRNAILRCAGQSSPLLGNRRRMSVFPDFTTTVAKWRAAFAKLKKELHAHANVKFGLQYPATLQITMSSGQTYRFEDLDQALEFFNKKFESPAPESDQLWDSQTLI